LGAALIGLPSGIMLTLLSTRIGSLTGRFGVRPFLVAGPLVMALGMLLWLRVGPTSTAWTANLADLASIAPPVDALTGPLVAVVVFGLGLCMLVTPITSGLMNSVPSRNAGLASAINNALSRVGQPLVAAAVFIAISGAFYSTLAAAVPGTDPAAPALRAAYQPLNPPPANAPPALAAAAKAASTDAYHLAAIIAAALLAAGAAVNAVGLRGKPEVPGKS
jgi:hypothetical protein